jgi:putative exosortase-associated protein (TIGR04073 family)
MKRLFCALALVLLVTTQLHASNEQQPENITSKMAVKFGRGITNLATSPIEIPKQTVLMTRDLGFPGLLVGPFGGVLMTGYRAIIGVAEIVFFMVPAPGYYDKMIEPEFVWEGWGAKEEPALLEPAPQP